MALKKAHEVDRFLRQNISAWPIFLVYGPDRGLVVEVTSKLIAKLGVDTSDPFCFINLTSGNFDADPFCLLNEVQTISLFGGLRLIVVKGASSHKGLISSLPSLLEMASVTKSIVIIEAGDLRPRDDLRKSLELSDAAMVLPCYKDDNKNLAQIIDESVAAMGLTIMPEAKDYLLGQLGGDRLATRNEIEKLCLYAKELKTISVEHVQAVVSDVAQTGTSIVVDSVLLGDLWQLELDFERFKTQGGNISWLLMELVRQFALLQKLKVQSIQLGLTANEAVAQAKPAIFYKRKALITRALNNWSVDRLTEVNARLSNLALEMRKNSAFAIDLLRNALLSIALAAKNKN